MIRRRGTLLAAVAALLLLAGGSYLFARGAEPQSGVRPWSTAIDGGPTDLPSQSELEQLADDASSGNPTAVAKAFVTPTGQDLSADTVEQLARQPLEFVYSSLATFGTRAASIDGAAQGQQWRFILSKGPNRWQIVTMIPLP